MNFQKGYRTQAKVAEIKNQLITPSISVTTDQIPFNNFTHKPPLTEANHL